MSLVKSNEGWALHPLLEQVKRGDTPDLAMFIDAFGNIFDLLHRLKTTPQDPEWHAEGNVYIHTQMVLEQTYKLLEGKAAHLDSKKRMTLILAAVFHDIAKPLVTRSRFMQGRERIISPHHADRGRSYLAYKLPELGLSPECAREVMALVGHHHDPKQLVTKEKPDNAYKRLARLAYIELLYWLEQADLRGRLAKDLEEQLETLELFRIYAEDIGVWDIRDPYASWCKLINENVKAVDSETRNLITANAIRDAEAELIYTPHEAIARSYSYRDAYAELIILCGPSGSGKSTWYKQHLPDHHVISLDDLREKITGKREDQSKNGQVLQAAREQLKAHLRNHEKVVWDATSLRQQHRSAVAQLGFDYKAFVTLVVFHLPESEISERNKGRSYAVPDEVLRRQLDHAEFPYITEAHRIVFVNQQL